MARDLTLLEDLEADLYDLLVSGGLYTLLACGVYFLLNSGIAVLTLAIGASVAMLIGTTMRQLRYGERTGRITDRVVILERGIRGLSAGINSSIDTMKKAFAQLGAKPETLEDIVNV